MGFFEDKINILNTVSKASTGAVVANVIQNTPMVTSLLGINGNGINSNIVPFHLNDYLPRSLLFMLINITLFVLFYWGTPIMKDIMVDISFRNTYEGKVPESSQSIIIALYIISFIVIFLYNNVLVNLFTFTINSYSLGVWWLGVGTFILYLLVFIGIEAFVLSYSVHLFGICMVFYILYVSFFQTFFQTFIPFSFNIPPTIQLKELIKEYIYFNGSVNTETTDKFGYLEMDANKNIPKILFDTIPLFSKIKGHILSDTKHQDNNIKKICDKAYLYFTYFMYISLFVVLMILCGLPNRIKNSSLKWFSFGFNGFLMLVVFWFIYNNVLNTNNNHNEIIDNLLLLDANNNTKTFNIKQTIDVIIKEYKSQKETQDAEEKKKLNKETPLSNLVDATSMLSKIIKYTRGDLWKEEGNGIQNLFLIREAIKEAMNYKDDGSSSVDNIMNYLKLGNGNDVTSKEKIKKFVELVQKHNNNELLKSLDVSKTIFSNYKNKLSGLVLDDNNNIRKGIDTNIKDAIVKEGMVPASTNNIYTSK
jgi:hypothetical protein